MYMPLSNSATTRHAGGLQIHLVDLACLTVLRVDHPEGRHT
jgi:hypothetical protein